MRTIENWKLIRGFDGKYEVSDHGKVRRSSAKEMLRVSVTQKGYPYVTLSIPGNSKNVMVHILVAAAFLGDRPSGLVINHIDGVKTNNHYSNLEYCTSADNIRHAYRTGLMKLRRGSDHFQSKLTEQQVAEIVALEGTATHAEIGQRFGVGRKTVAYIYAGKLWSHLTGRVFSERNTNRGYRAHVHPRPLKDESRRRKT